MGRHLFNATMVVTMVIPDNKLRQPLECLILAGQSPAGVVRTVFDRTEQRF